MKETIRRAVIVSSYVALFVLWLNFRELPLEIIPNTVIRWPVLWGFPLVAHITINWIFQKGDDNLWEEPSSSEQEGKDDDIGSFNVKDLTKEEREELIKFCKNFGKDKRVSK